VSDILPSCASLIISVVTMTERRLAPAPEDITLLIHVSTER
jgi:hypothetical protein